MTPPDIRLTLRLKPDLHQQLKQAVAQHPYPLTCNEWVREAIQDKLRRDQPVDLTAYLHVTLALQTQLFALLHHQSYTSAHLVQWVLPDVRDNWHAIQQTLTTLNHP